MASELIEPIVTPVVFDPSTRTLVQDGGTPITFPKRDSAIYAIAEHLIEGGHSEMTLDEFLQKRPGAEKKHFARARLDLAKKLKRFPSLDGATSYDGDRMAIHSDLHRRIVVVTET